MRRTASIRIRVAAVAAVVVVPLAATGTAAAQTLPPAPGVTSAAAILVSLNADPGRVLFARNVHARRAPASLTKIVTALVARDQYRLDDVVTASPLVLQTHGSDLGLEPGMRITVRDLLYSLLLKSANDAGMALAAHHPLGYEHFIKLMNQTARAVGTRQSQFRNPHGLDQIGHYSSAWDMALLTRAVLADPVLAAIVAAPSHRMPWKDGRERLFDNHNKLIARYGAVGVKTGFTNNAGHCLIAAARTSGGIAFSVVMGSADHYRDSTALLDYAKTVEPRLGAGGGPAEGGPELDAPPNAPGEQLAATASASPPLDPRDDARWLVLMAVIAALTVASAGVRRRHPLGEVVEAYPWMEPLLAGRGRTESSGPSAR